MTKLEKALYRKWISRFGRNKIRELAKGLKAADKSIAAKTDAIVDHGNADSLNDLLLEGFDGFFHQSVFVRKIGKTAASYEAMRSLSVDADYGNVSLEKLECYPKEIRCLFMANRKMEFVLESSSVVAKSIPFPVAVSLEDDTLTVQVLTMQVTIKTWSEILGDQIRRTLTIIRADDLADMVQTCLMQAGVDLGDYIDYSKTATKLLKQANTNTYSGTLEIGQDGSTKHNTIRGKGKRPLRVSMPAKFAELVSAQRLVNAEIELKDEYLSLTKGSKIALYPTTGKIAFRSNLQGCDPDEFISSLAK